MALAAKTSEEVMREWEASVCECLEKQDFARLKATNEDLELALGEEEWERGGRGEGGGRWSVQMMTYLVLGELENARFLWMRIPHDVKQADQQLQVRPLCLSLPLSVSLCLSLPLLSNGITIFTLSLWSL
jgi:hypothetical protein